MTEPRRTTSTEGDSDAAGAGPQPPGAGSRAGQSAGSSAGSSVGSSVGWRAVGAVAVVLATLTVVWWGVVRATADGRVVRVHGPAADTMALPAPSGIDEQRVGELSGADTIRVLAWNIAHGRGNQLQGGLFNNYRRGDAAERTARLARIGAVIRESDADIVVLNEVDFDASWSDGLNQAETLARAAGYPYRVEQRNYDYSALFADFAFGNAVLSRLPVNHAREVPIPPHSRLEAELIGAKTASAVAVKTGGGALTVVPIHLEFRSERTRLAAVPALRRLIDEEAVLMAGDFNTTPAGWGGRVGPTAVGELLDAGLRSPRAAGDPSDVRLTFPSTDLTTAIDWVLAEPPIRVLEARVLTAAAPLSDHLPVLSTVELRFPLSR